MSFRAQVIHSGHFMTSILHDDTAPDDDEDIEVDVVEDDDKSEETSSCSNHKKQVLDEKPITFYKFGPTKTQSIAIDVSLNKLNKCIKVAYNKMTTPKWKDFKGLRLHWKQRIRLNNVIWRAYYIEFRKNKPQKPKKPFCYFAVPDDDTTHQKIEGSILEGMYWKRRMEAVCAQYKRWRVRSKHNITNEKGGMVSICSSTSVSSMTGDIKRKRKGGHKDNEATVKEEPPTKLIRSMTPKHHVSDEWFDLDDLNDIFTDELFDSLSQPYMFPNPRELMQSGNADIMQPGLLPLQPTIEEIMMSLGDFPDSPPPPTAIDMPMNDNRSRPSTSTQQSQQTPTISTMRRSASSSSSLHQMQSQQQQQQPEEKPQQQQQLIHQPIPRQPPQDYMAHSGYAPLTNRVQPPQVMIDYRNQVNPNLMPTRQSSAITSQMLMLSHTSSSGISSVPQYSSSSQYTPNAFSPLRNMTTSQPHIQNAWKPQTTFLSTGLPLQHQSDVDRILNQGTTRHLSQSSVSDQYMPQFLQSPQTNTIHDPMMAAPSRNWWLESQLGASVQSPLSVSTPLTSQTGPGTPLSHLIGGAGSDAVTPPTSLFINSNLVDNSRTKMGTTLTQRLEQPPILATNNIFQADKKSFTPVTHQHQQSTTPIDFSTISRFRTTSLNSEPSSWRIPQLDVPITTYNHIPHSIAVTLPTTATTTSRSSILTPNSASSSAFGSPLPATNHIDLSVITPKIITPTKASPPSANADITSATIMRQTSCDVNLLSQTNVKEEMVTTRAAKWKRSKKESEDVVYEDTKDTVVTKEEPGIMSAPSSVKSMRRQVPDSTMHPEERKRILHLHAEQNRRSALKDGFDQLMDIIPDLYAGGVKPTNAVVLAKAADHIRRLQSEKWEKQQKKEEAKAKIEKLNQRIASLQTNLPASSSAASTSQMDSKTSLETFFDRYVKDKSKKDWRFWVMCQMMKPICVGQNNSFAAAVAGESSSKQEVSASCSDWLNKNWKATELRPMASTLLVSLATNTNILSEPDSLPGHVAQQLKNPF